MESPVIDEHGSPVLIEAVYMRYYAAYRHKADSVEDALSFLENGEDYGSLSSVGVFVAGEPSIVSRIWESDGPPTSAEAEKLRKVYAEAQEA